LFRDTGRLKDAEAAHSAALAIRKKLVADFPNQADLRNELAGSYVNLAFLCNQRRDFQAAKAYLENARPHHQAALKTNPRNPAYPQCHRTSCRGLARAKAGLVDRDSAVQAGETIRDFGYDPPANACDAAGVLAQCIPIVAKHDKLDSTQRDEATKFYGDT